MCDSKCIVIFPILINGDNIFALHIFALLMVFTDYIVKLGMSDEISTFF